MIQDTGDRTQDTGYRIQTNYKGHRMHGIQCTEYSTKNIVCGIYDTEYKIQGTKNIGYRIKDIR